MIFSESEFAEDEGLDLRDYWRIMQKQKWLIMAVCGSIIFATALFTLTRTPFYTARTTVLIERQSPNVLDIRSALSESLAPDEYDYYKTQYRILKSRALVAQVIREQGLERSLFAKKEKGFISKLLASVKALFPATSAQNRGANLHGVKSEFINTYVEKMLAIQPIRGTRLVEITITTPDPDLSARIVNVHSSVYIRKGIELRTHTNEEAQRFLEEKLVELKERVRKSEAALNQYRRDEGVISLDDKENIVVERLSDLNMRLTEAEAERIGLEAQSYIIRNRDYNQLPDVINNPLIQTLKEQQTRRESEHALLLQKFKSGYSEVAQLKAQIDETKTRLAREVERIVASVEAAYLTAAKKEEELRAKMEEQKAATLGLKDASVGYAILDREVDTNRQLYDSVLQRMKEMGVAAELRTSNVSVIDEAESPLTPSSPRIMFSLLLGACLGLMLGVGSAFCVEYLDTSLKTPEEVEQYLHVSSLGVIPNFLSVNGARGFGGTYTSPPLLAETVEEEEKTFLGNGQAGGPYQRSLVKSALEERASGNQTHKKELILSHHPLSLISESYRSLRVAILLSKAEETPKTILFTSATNSEGKTATTVNTAIVFAQMGVKILVIDGDLRRPRCHKMLDTVKKDPGLTEVLTGQRDLEEVIQKIPVGDGTLFFLSSGAIPPNPAELVSSHLMHETMAALRQNYDYIFLDTPPVMPVSDALLLATLVDGVIVVVAGQQTPKHLVKETRMRLQYARAKILGVVLNKIDMHSGDYGYYYGRYYSYYHPDKQKEETL